MKNSEILVIGSTGKTGHRIVNRLTEKGHKVKLGSRRANPRFDWSDQSNWDAVLDGVAAIYVSYAPDLAIPGAAETIGALVDKAVKHGVKRLVLLSGRGEEEAQNCERLIQREDIEWTIVRASWFSQNFSEGAFLDMVLAGEVALPAGDVGEPFVDADDIADVAVAALTEEGHSGEVYEVTGPQLLTFADAIERINEVTEKEVRFTQIPSEIFASGVAQAGLPKDIEWLLNYLFATVLDGRNAQLCDGVQRALGREPKDFSSYVQETAASGVWGRQRCTV